MLKNDIKTNYKQIPQNSQSYIKTGILQGLQDPNAQIRAFTGNVITELVRQAGITSWPDILPTLLSTAANESGSIPLHVQEGAMTALWKTCEDNKRALSRTYQSECPLDYLLPRLLNLMSSPSAKVRAGAIASMNVFVSEKSQNVDQVLDSYLSRLFSLAHDQNEEVRKYICRAIVYVAEVSPHLVAPHMDGLVTYMINQQRNVDDEELSLDAAEFWLFVSEDPDLRAQLGPFLPKIVPVLLESMVYQEEDVLRLEDEAEDADTEDREQDIKPQFASKKVSRGFSAAGPDANGSKNADGINLSKANLGDELDEGEVEDDIPDDEQGDDPEAQWNLRKCSAASLDVLAGLFHQDVFDATLPYLRANMVHSDWPNREAAVLAIGAIADGCMEFVTPHLPELVPFLISLLQDPQPVVRQITCWSLGRYSAWASLLDDNGKQQFFLPMMDGILKRMLDSNKRVQEAAASAFANLEEKANKQLDNPAYCGVIIRQFAQCFAKYKDRNMFILYDCVQTLAEHVGPSLQDPELVHLMMSSLINRWEKISDQSHEMFPLLECLSYVATALGASFTPYSGPIFQRCIRVIYQNLQDSLAAANNAAVDQPDQDFLVTSLDLLSAIIQALPEEKGAQLVTESRPSMYDLIQFCMENPNTEVRQSAYALLGDCAIFVYPTLRGSLSKILPVLVEQLDLSKLPPNAAETGYAVTNNACWSCGEIAVRAREGMSAYIETLLQRLYGILCDSSVPRSLHENAAIAIGRLGSGCAEALAPHLSTFGPHFLQNMAGVDATDEKIQALEGVAEMALQNPHGLEHCILNFINEIARTDLSGHHGSPDFAYHGAFEAFQQVRGDALPHP